jgi:hypothetical protein
MVVTAPDRPINFNGWIGEGYTVIDLSLQVVLIKYGVGLVLRLAMAQ